MASGGGGWQPFHGQDFNWVFLVYVVVCGVLSVFFLLYFNRVFGSLVSWGIRTWSWHRYRVYIDVQALQVSLLGGRVFFTGLRYHGNNETILVQNGHITWSYWLRRVRGVHIGKGHKAAPVEGQGEGASHLPCRINVSLIGVEWFVYNRSAAYDGLLAQMVEAPAADDQDSNVEPLTNADRNSNSSQENGGLDEPSSESSSEQPGRNFKDTAQRRAHTRNPSRSRKEGNAASAQTPDEDELPVMLQLFPIHLECEKAALVMGNDNTRAVLIIKAKGFTGEINASETVTPDPYRQLYRLRFDHPVVELRENEDFKEDQANRAVREQQGVQGLPGAHRRSFLRQQRRRLYNGLRNMVPYWSRSVESLSDPGRTRPGTADTQAPGFGHWQGLSRYLDEHDQDGKTRWASVEYAAVPTILDSPAASFVIYWDAVGKVQPGRGEQGVKTTKTHPGNINGDQPPAWGITLSINGGSLNYGPWADRQRAELQRVFFPSLCKDAIPARPLSPGSSRVPTQFKLLVELDAEAVVRIPVREDSKNWRWKSKDALSKQPRARDKRKSKGLFRKSDPAGRPAHQRPYGWLDIKVAANTTFSYSMDMVASSDGFSNTLLLDLPRAEISSSINHELLWRSGHSRIACDLSTPLKWNGLRQWHFDVGSENLELFLLRDHVFLLIDLVDDWASGPPADYLVFTPFRYSLDIRLDDLRLNLNVNDVNIVNNPTDQDDNTYIVIASPLLVSKVCIPIGRFRPAKNAIPFEVKAETGSVSLHVPPWNTQAAFLDSTEVGHLENLVVDGQYHYNATASPLNTDTLVLNVTGQSPVATIHGFVVRYFMMLKDNYFGDHVHFRTLEEFQESARMKERDPTAEAATRPPPKKSNDLDVILSLRADDPKVMLPAHLYSSERNIQIDLASLAADLRFTNYYMDLDLVLSPLNLSLDGLDDGLATPISATTTTQLFIDGLHVYGHRVFGLPPSEPTYVCNWDISAGALTGECNADFLTTLISAGKAFAFSFDDDENALIPHSAIVLYDVTFLRTYIQSVRLWIRMEEAAFLVSAGAIEANYNDWAKSHYSKRANVRIPDVQLFCVNPEAASRQRSRPYQPIDADSVLQTSVHLAIVGRKAGFSRLRKLQQELIQREDQRTHRAEFLLLPHLLDALEPDLIDPQAQCVPPLPLPTYAVDGQGELASLSSTTTSKRSTTPRRQSSFLSFSSESRTSSIVRPQSSKPSSRGTRRGDALKPFTSITPAAEHENMYRPGTSTSNSRHSGFYSTLGELVTDRHDVVHNTVAFSSQYFAPYFPLEQIRPGTRDLAVRSVEHDVADDDNVDAEDFDLGDIDPELLNEDFAYQSTIVELPSGITGVLTPASLQSMAKLLTALQPHTPADVLDTLQVGSMDVIFGMQNEQKMEGRIRDLALRFPNAHLRFINSHSPDASNFLQAGKDAYDLSVGQLTVANRSETLWQDALQLASRKTRGSFHVRVDSIGFAAAESHTAGEKLQAAVTAQIEHVMVSLGTRDLAYLDADVGGIHGSMASEKIEYLAALIQRTSTLASDLGRLFSEVALREKQVTELVVHRLVEEGQKAADPSFLIRPSAVLRSAPQHLRTFDSWKMMVRLRQMWGKLPSAAQERLTWDCMSQRLSLPPDAEDKVLRVFQRWRGWDLDDAAESVLLRNIFGASKKTGQGPAGGLPTLAAVRLRETQFLLDPGPRQNEMTLLDLTIRAETHRQLFEQGGAEAGGGADGPMTIVNVYCGDAAVKLNWEVCELAEDVLRLYNQLKGRTRADEPPNLGGSGGRPESPRISQRRNIHAVLALGEGSVTVETINLYASSLGHGFKVSMYMKHGSEGSMDTSFVLGWDSVAWRVRSRSQLLSKFQLEKPSVFFCHEMRETENITSHAVKATVRSQDLSLYVRQDPIVLLEVLDLVIRDEAAQLYRLKRQLWAHTAGQKPGQSPPTNARDMVERLSTVRINVAMFMDQYTISVPLLRSMTYRISGTVARAALAANYGREIILDLDIKENSHEIQIDVNNVPHSISLLQIPPTNGRVTSQTSEGEHLVTVFASLELVQLDASAVYSLLSALNRPEISHTITDIRQQVKVMQAHVQEIFGGGDVAAPQLPVGPTQPGSAVAYSVHLTLAGLEIFGDTPLKSEPTPIAHLLFSLGGVHVEVANRMEQAGPILAYPEVQLDLRHIHFGIEKGKAESMTSCGNLAFGAHITATSMPADEDGEGRQKQGFNIRSDGFQINLSPDTVSTVVDVLGYMGDKIKGLDTSRELEYLRKLRQSRPRIAINDEHQEDEEEADVIESILSSISYTMEIRDIQIAWLVNTPLQPASAGRDDLVLSLQRIEFGTRTRHSARLTIEDLQVQMVPPGQDRRVRSANSALLPEVIFNVAYISTSDTRRLAFQAVGKSLDLRLNSGFIIPAANINHSIGLSIKNVRQASEHWDNPVKASLTRAMDNRLSDEEPKPDGAGRQRGLLGSNRRLESLLVDADFAGAVVYMTGKQGAVGTGESVPAMRGSRQTTVPGRYGQFNQDDAATTTTTSSTSTSTSTVLRSPGLAWKMEYRDSGQEDPSLYGEVKIDASSNILYPSVVPLVMDMTSSVKEIVRDDPGDTATTTSRPQDLVAAKAKSLEEQSNILTTDPSAVLGRLKLNLGLRICRQAFSLSCQPIARVAATASFEDVYFTVNTVRSADQGNFFAISGAFTKLQASVKHVYSRESTGSFEVDSIVLSLLNSKHVSGTSGVSAILKVSPMKVFANVRQLQDFLLFREIWLPGEIRQASSQQQGRQQQQKQQQQRRRPVMTTTTPTTTTKLAAEASQGSGGGGGGSHLVQRYQQVAATAAFPWTATISISALEINVDLGQALGKSVFAISDFWVSSKKTSDWEQNLCLGFRHIGVDSTGRMSGFVALQDFQLRTSIQWPEREQALNETPLIQASIGFTQLRLKAAFDYQAFLVADITAVEFLMYNVRRSHDSRGDRLVATLDGGAVQVMGTTTSAAQAMALYQAFQRLAQESRANYAASLREIEKFLRRSRSTTAGGGSGAPDVVGAGLSKAAAEAAAAGWTGTGAGAGTGTGDQDQEENNDDDDALAKSPISLDTDVVVTLKALNLGCFPSAFSDHQVFKMEALDANARFEASAVPDSRRVHSTLALTLGQLRIGLAAVRDARTTTPAAPPTNRALTNELSVEDVVRSSTGARGGTILRVPRVSATMETWQLPRSRHIDYVFKSAFEGKVEVGWNYSRISYLRGMWANHAKSLAQAYGRELPLLTSSIRVTGVPERNRERDRDNKGGADGGGGGEGKGEGAEKITAEVKVPLSTYEYRALEPPVIETPQLRDMGEATPPLEWIGLHRDRLPNLTHQIVIVALLELAGEVEDAYERILGSS